MNAWIHKIKSLHNKKYNKTATENKAIKLKEIVIIDIERTSI